MSKPYWVLDDVLGVPQWMSCIRTDRLQQGRTSKYDGINSDYLVSSQCYAEYFLLSQVIVIVIVKSRCSNNLGGREKVTSFLVTGYF